VLQALLMSVQASNESRDCPTANNAGKVQFKSITSSRDCMGYIVEGQRQPHAFAECLELRFLKQSSCQGSERPLYKDRHQAWTWLVVGRRKQCRKPLRLGGPTTTMGRIRCSEVLSNTPARYRRCMEGE